MNPSSTISPSKNFCQLKLFYALLLFFLFNFFCATYGSISQISYGDHCAAIVPASSPTVRARAHIPVIQFTASYHRGGEKILGKNPSDQLFNSSDISVSFYTTRYIYKTSTSGIYKVQARLRFSLPFAYSKDSGYERSLRFLLSGFWSEYSRKLCMVGTASWQSKEGKPLKLQAVFEVNYAQKNSTVFNSLAKGTLKSLSSSDSPSYFEPIEIVSFHVFDDYNYTLASNVLCLGGNDVPQNQFLSLQPRSICSTLLWRFYDLDLEYAAGCKSTKDCSPFEVDTAYLSLYAFQCSEDEKMLRYIITFQNRYWTYESFDPKTTLIGEGSWNSKRNQLCIVACRILNPYKSLQDVRVGDCSMRLSIRFPIIWTIKDTSRIVGLIWTNKTSTDPGYFKTIKASSSNDNNGYTLPGLKYEYTLVDKVRELCPKKAVKKNGEKFPEGNSYDMRFDMSVKHSEEAISWGTGIPISVNNEIYEGNSVILSESGYEEETSTSNASQMNISYKMTFFPHIVLKKQISSLNSSLNHRGQLEISAEGVYDAETGNLCMVGCRKLYSKNASESLDCEMLIDVKFSPLNSRVGSSNKGTIQSRRAKSDSLYFEQLNIYSTSVYTVQGKEFIWRMDMEVIMVLISNTLACIFVASQLFYVKKNPQILPFISLVMLTLLTLGHMIPLVLNLEALFLKNHNKQNTILRGDGWLELNEVSLRLVTLVVFLLLLCLLQLAWTARTQDGNGKHFWSAEKKTALASLLLYAVGGLITFLIELEKNGNGNGNEKHSSHFSSYTSTIYDESSANSQQSYTLRYLKSYAGLVLDGFLFPQILFNIFKNSKEKSLSCSFYIGTTLVRLVPHAYDLYRVHTFTPQDFNGSSYIYANHSADFYSIAWDVIIPCGCIVFAVIIWLQQRFGGCCILPRKIRELESYEKVPVVSSE
ncbi:hypothetical protein ACH5RR_028070 [Cinchona calisaya]|uniref:RING-type E3 ubiquitin transferase n=1 Tax=Cinchona calisaya TaxID=153742 RepID=A0ABD2YPP1_9GENT